MTLFRQITPLPDENLAGLIARAAGANFYIHAHDILVQAGLGHIRPETIAGKSVDTAATVARVLGAEPSSLLPLYHPAIDDRCIDFFGTELRSVHRETKLRRVSPSALIDKAYVRAVWSVRPLSFDPETRETLISHCPVCGGKLGFTHTWGVEFCEHCIETDAGLPSPVVDLRDFPQPLVAVDDEEALDFVVGLIAPYQSKGQDALLHDDLTGLNRGQLFEMTLALASAMEADETGMLIDPMNVSRLVTNPSPRHLSDAGRMIMNWPTGFHDRCRVVAGGASNRPGHWGVYKEFGAFAQVRKDDHLHPLAQDAISKALETVMGDLRPSEAVTRKTTRSRQPGIFIGVRQILREVAVSSKVTTKMAAHPDMITHRRIDNDPMSPVLFYSWQALGVLDHYKDLVEEASLATKLGLPPDALHDLARIGLIDGSVSPWRSTAMDLRGGGTTYSKASADQFIDMMVNGLEFRKPPKGYIPFSEAMLMFPAGRRPWLPVMLPILFQDVDAVFHRNVAAQPKVRNIFGSISVNAHQIEQYRERILEEHASFRRDDIGRVSAVMTIMILGIYNHLVFMALDKANLIDVNEDGADYGSLLDFAEKYIFLNEAAVRSRNSRLMIRPWLEVRGVKPEFDFDCKGGTIYLREQVEPWLEMKV